MMCIFFRRWLAWAMALAVLSTTAAAAPQTRAPLTVFAAASLTDALQASADAFTRRSGIPVRLSFASSAVLARQIEAGAPADLFFSADAEWMDHVQARGLIDTRSRANLLRGRLALVAPAGNPLRLVLRRGAPIAAALGANGRLACGDPNSVPAGRYAKAALTRLGLWPSLSERLARTENVRVALALVARGEAPLGIVYETDARAEPRVRIVGIFPPESHPPILYPIALTARAQGHATTFYRFLRSDAARAIFRRYGFALP